MSVSIKHEREWLESKPEAITNFAEIANTLADKLIINKQKMIDNFVSVMATSKYENSLSKYRGNNLLSDLYRQGMNNKTSMTQTTKNKIRDQVSSSRRVQNFVVKMNRFAAVVPTLIGALPPYTGFENRRKQEESVAVNHLLGVFGAGVSNAPTPYNVLANYLINNFNWIPINPQGGASGQNVPGNYLMIGSHKIPLPTTQEEHSPNNLEKLYPPEYLTQIIQWIKEENDK